MRKKQSTSNIKLDNKETVEEKIDKIEKESDEILKEWESQSTVVRDLSSENSILEDLKNLKPTSNKIYTEKDLKEKIEDIALLNEAMKNFNFFLNKEAKSFTEQAKKIEDIEEDEDPNIFLKLAPSDERERRLFKDKLVSSGEKRRPIYINIGDCDLFFEYFDKDDFPVFSFNRQNLIFFFGNDIIKFKEYIESNKCSFGLGINIGLHRINEKPIKFDNLMVEVIEKKKKNNKEEKPIEQPKEEEKPINKTKIDPPLPQEENKNLHRVICKVKFIDSDPMFILTEDPATIFKKFDGSSIVSKVKSIKIIGEGILG